MAYSWVIFTDIFTVDHFSAEKPIENKMDEILQPTKIASLQDAMGLTDNKKLYFYCQVSLYLSLLYM